MKLSHLIYIVLFQLGILNLGNAQVTSSILKEGTVYQLQISQEGVYGLTAKQIQEMGFNSTNEITVYGFQGGILPQPNASPRTEDLIPLPQQHLSTNIGSYQHIFYTQGVNLISSDSLLRFSLENNIYDNYAYVYVKQGKNYQDIPLRTATPTADLAKDYFTEIIHHEREKVSLLSSGRQLLGESFSINSNNLKLDFPVTFIKKDAPIHIRTVTANASTTNCTFSFSLNGIELGTSTPKAITGYQYGYQAYTEEKWLKTNSSIEGNSSLTFDINFSKTDNNIGNGYLDFITLNIPKIISSQDPSSIIVRTGNKEPNINLTIDNLPAFNGIWNISKLTEPQQITIPTTSNAVILEGFGQSYAFFHANNILSPTIIGTVENQNLHGINQADLIIIYAPLFEASALKLAEFRRSYDKLVVETVSIDQVYHEFSGGRQDVTAVRDFLRHLYNNSAQQLKYALFIGDASFDFKNSLYTDRNTNFIPIYESRESLHPVFTFSSEDYFGFFDDHEGVWEECSTCNDHIMNIGIGRLPVRTTKQAEELVHKIISYNSNPVGLGDWRQKILFVADDKDAKDYSVSFHAQSNELATHIEKDYPQFHPQRLFMDNYPQEATGNGESSPIMRSLLYENVHKGALVVNYIGHGSEAILADEVILSAGAIEQWSNTNVLPIMVTATCEFGRYDNPARTSGAEIAILNPIGGAIGLLTTTRPVYASSNFELNKSFYNNLLKPLENGEMPRLGDVARKTKNGSLSGVNNRNFALLGDPSMRLAYPEQEIITTEILQNGKPVTQMKAMGTYTIKGQVQSPIRQEKLPFEGTLRVELYDKKQYKTTLGDRLNNKITYQEYQNTIFRGDVPISEGSFEVSFTIPRDIDYTTGNAKMRYYAYDSVNMIDAGGTDSLLLGGSYATIRDKNGPEIDLFLDNTSFYNGQTVSKEPLLLATLRDHQGINISGKGIGHFLEAYLDGDINNSIVLNEYYVASLEGEQKGNIVYALPTLTAGTHTLTMTAWDNHNNSTQKTISFQVANQYPIEVSNISIFPNPVKTNDQCWFYFDHQRPEEDINVEIRILDQRGKVIQMKNFVLRKSNELQEKILLWDGKGTSGHFAPPGLYFYQLLLKMELDGATTLKSGKLIRID